MRGILYLIASAIGLGAVFAWLLIAAIKNGQFDDLDDPPERMLRDPE
jgi:cbb3-type cytochrome oxidase maturation protein